MEAGRFEMGRMEAGRMEAGRMEAGGFETGRFGMEKREGYTGEGYDGEEYAGDRQVKEGFGRDYIYMVTGNIMIVSLNAELDHHLAEEMRGVMDYCIDVRGVNYILLDFSNIGFMDSSGIGLIMGRFKKLVGRGRVVVVGANDSIRRIMLISGLHKLVEAFDDVNEALAMIEQEVR